MDNSEGIVERLRAVESSSYCMSDSVTTCWHRNPDGPEAADLIETLTMQLAEVREALAPSGDTKAAYMGEFKFDVMVSSIDEDDDELVPMQVYVPWTTIKEIMAAIRDRTALSDRRGG